LSVARAKMVGMSAFLDLHRPGDPLLMPNPWDAGSARVLTSLGFRALATTSAGFANALGRPDGAVTREEAIAHAAAIVQAVDVPVSADLENGFADDPHGVAKTVRKAVGVGLAGCSVEDATKRDDDPIYNASLAAERVAAAVDAAGHGFVITARAENFLHGRADLADTIARLQRYQEAGAHVLYAPGLTSPEQIRAVISSVDRPVNVLALPTAPPVAELAKLGVARISVGSGFALAALGALVEAGRELLEQGTYGFWQHAKIGREAAGTAFTAPGARP
jgi:2-methylisocitrate lyase-like PEP mutase family enzyme